MTANISIYTRERKKCYNSLSFKISPQATQPEQSLEIFPVIQNKIGQQFQLSRLTNTKIKLSKEIIKMTLHL